jgi:hypothetical protein
MNIIGGVDRAEVGTVEVNGERIRINGFFPSQLSYGRRDDYAYG